MARAPRQFYLTNKELLKEIHKSKMSYCNDGVEEEHFMYDLILDDVDEIDNDKIEEAKISRASRLTKNKWWYFY